MNCNHGVSMLLNSETNQLEVTCEGCKETILTIQLSVVLESWIPGEAVPATLDPRIPKYQGTVVR